MSWELIGSLRAKWELYEKAYLLSFSKNEENIFFVTSVAADYDYNESRLEITKGSLNKNMPSRHPRFLPTPLFKITTF